ncbi:hypothetical protein WA158_007169 [Blastocystis sp. Blastoise]
MIDIPIIIAISVLCAWLAIYQFVVIPVSISVITISTCIAYLGARRGAYLQHSDVMSKGDVASFPFIASATLFGIYLLFKKFDNIDFKGYLFYYILFVCYNSLVQLLTPLLRKFINKSIYKRTFTIPYLDKVDIDISVEAILSYILAFPAIFWYYKTESWIGNDIFGTLLCIQAISEISVGSVKNGILLLGLLFFYDIFWVFGTEVMVTVGIGMKGPVKFMFPKHIPIVDNNTMSDFSALGLGDVCIPGFFMALLYRYDIYKANVKSIEDFQQKDATYFHISIFSYLFALLTTTVVMLVFNHPQPALLYISPALIISCLLTGYFKKDITNLFAYDEEKPEIKTKTD